jgi:NADH:ubiquinone oxidoreductase subunit C
MEVQVKNAAMTAFLEEIAAAYRDMYPERYADFLKAMAEENKTLLNTTALSNDGTILSLGKLPTELYAFIKFQANKRLGIKDFFSDEANFRLLMKVWPSARVKRTPSTFVHIQAQKD